MKKLLVMILPLAFTFLFAEPANQVPNFQHPQYQIYTGGQPSPDGFEWIAAMGIKTVINVLPDQERIPEEAGVVNANNMEYVMLPFQTYAFEMETIEQFADLLMTSQKPVLIHCSTGNHVGGLWFAYRVIAQKAPMWLALREAREIGMQPQLEERLFTWVAQHS
jgi:uncharacterized protein (TIGR01244 family)